MMRFNAGQRKVVKIVLISSAALLLLGLIIDAAGAASPGISRSDVALLNKYGTGRRMHYSGWNLGTFLTELIRSPRLYVAGLLLGLAVFIHKDTTKD